MTKYKNKEELKQVGDFKNYIIKDMFLFKLTIEEIRLCAFLNSRTKTIDTMTYEEKAWVVGGKNKKITSLHSAEQKLKECNLIQEDGTGFDIKTTKKEFCQVTSEVLYACKTQRELFVECLDVWHVKGSFTYVKKEYINTVFGDDTRNRNRNIKRLSESMGRDIKLEERENDYLYIRTKKTETVKEAVVVKAEEQVETKEEINTEEERVELKNTFDESKFIAYMNSMYFSSDYIEPPNYTISEKEFEV